MVKRCFVPFCTTGRKYDRNSEQKFSLFKAPNNAVLLQKWREVVPIKERELNSSDRICEKHFEKRYIIPRYQQSKYGDFFEDHLRSKLAPDAIPTIFDESCSKLIPFKPLNIKFGNPTTNKLVLPHVEVNENDFVPICYKCLVGDCVQHKVYQNA